MRKISKRNGRIAIAIAVAAVVLIGIAIGVVNYVQPAQSSVAEQKVSAQKQMTHPDAGVPIPPQEQASASSPTPVPDGLFPFSGFIDETGTNFWRGEVNGKQMEVYAGAPKKDESQGVISVLRAKLDSSGDPYTYFDNYPTPTKHGIVTIVGEEKAQLTIKAADGTSFVFDLVKNQYAP